MSGRAELTDLAALTKATGHLDPPLVALDAAVLRRNAADLVRRANGTPIRVTSTSVRCRAVLDAALAIPGFRGVLAYSLREAIWLVHKGFRDVVVGCPTVDEEAWRALVDDPERRLLRTEGAGEVQTPVQGLPADGLRVGNRVWFRPAKAGELCERFDRIHVIEGGGVTRSVPTYRGEGRAFG